MDRFAAYGGRLPLKTHLVGAALAVLLAACGNTGNGGGPGAGRAGQSGSAPVSLVRSFDTRKPAIRTMSLDSGAVAKAVDRYRINKKADLSPYKKIGVDLNGDGVVEALVYFTGDAWCVKTGCTLVIFRSGQFGYRAISTIRRVKLPLRVAASSNQGWRDLIVKTGGGGMPEQTVELKFTGRGYPGNATTIAPIPQGVPVESTVILDAPPPAAEPVMGNATSMGGHGSQGVAQASQPISLQP